MKPPVMSDHAGQDGRTGRRSATGFTLVEMLVASVLAAVLLAAILAVTAGMARERQRLAAADQATAGPDRPEALLALLRRDLSNADTVGPTPDGRGVVLVGHGALDPRTLVPTDRLVRVTYRVVKSDGTGRTGPGTADVGGGGGAGAVEATASCLVREQRALDDPSRPAAWGEVVVVGAARLEVSDAVGGAEAAEAKDGGGPVARPVPRRVRVRVEFSSGAIDEVLWLR